MQKNNILILLLFFFALLSKAQNTNAISGVVIDTNTKEPVVYASIIIKSVTDNKIITGGITDDYGRFKINKIPNKTFLLEIQFMGYKTFLQKIVLTKNENKIDLGSLYLEEDAESLETVEIIAERSTIEQKIDRKVIHIGKDLTTTGATASDLMQNLPSIDVDQNGRVSLRGNDNVRVLIDGKPTNLDTNTLLQQIPSTSIKKIELITNPSAKYNPEGMSGIINIVLNKSAKIGFNGSISTGLNIGKKTRFNSAINLNYRKGKFNFYGNYSNKFGEFGVVGTIKKLDDNSNEVWHSGKDSNSHLYKVGVDYYVDDKNTLSIYTNQNMLNGRSLGGSVINFEDATNQTQIFDKVTDNIASTYNFDYKHTFNKSNHNIEFEIDHNKYNGNENSDFDENGIVALIYNDYVTNDRENTTINLDYINPITDNTKIEIGVETRIQKTNNSYQTTNINYKNSDYKYDRDIHSFYATFSQDFNKWSYQLGARLENYKVKGTFNQIDTETSIFKDEIFSIYPSAFLKYTPDEAQKNSYQISFSRRVDRPGLDQINPIRLWSAPRVTNVGNPNLNPQFTNSVEVNYSHKLKKGNLTTGIFYRDISDEITRFVFLDPEDNNRTLFSYKNNKDNNAFGFEVSGNYKPTKWWSFNASFDLYAQKLKSLVQDELLEVNNTVYNFKMNNSFKVTQKLSLQVFGLYRGATETLQFKTKDFYFLNAGARYNLLKGKGTISINFNDIFHTQRYTFNSSRPIQQIGEFNWDSQTVYFGFSYRFGGGKNRKLTRKSRDKNEKSGDSF